MRIKSLLVAVGFAVAGCESALDVKPVTSVPEDDAIIDAVSARAALAGAYDALQSTSYYGESFYTFGDLSSDNARHSGTFTAYGDADQNVLTSDNGQVDVMWTGVYDAINRANVLIQKVPGVPGLSQAEKDQIVGEAYFIRALGHHDLLKYWGGVPIKTAPVDDISEASNVTRASVPEVYTQVLADLTQAENLITASATRAASDGAVRALRARVLLYRASPGPTGQNLADWANVEARATDVISMSYTLAPTFASLFSATGAATTEDIFRLRFNDQDRFWAGYYYLPRGRGGRAEVTFTTDLRNSFEAGDARLAWTIGSNTGTAFAGKFPTANGLEHPHVIRLAEVILIRAEARAQQNNLVGAVADYNLLRVRAGLPAHVLGVNVITQQDVLNAIARERRSELAFEGDRWPDLVRTGTALAVMSAHNSLFPSSPANFQILYPIPQPEIDVTRNPDGSARLVQNPGY